MSTGGRIALSVAIVAGGGFGWLLLAWFFAYFSCTWEASCSTRHHVTYWVLLAGGAVALIGVLRAVWRDRTPRRRSVAK